MMNLPALIRISCGAACLLCAACSATPAQVSPARRRASAVPAKWPDPSLTHSYAASRGWNEACDLWASASRRVPGNRKLSVSLRQALEWQQHDQRRIRWLAPDCAMVQSAELSQPLPNGGVGVSSVLAVYSRDNSRWKRTLHYQDAPIFVNVGQPLESSAPRKPQPQVIHRLSGRPQGVALPSGDR